VVVVAGGVATREVRRARLEHIRTGFMKSFWGLMRTVILRFLTLDNFKLTPKLSAYCSLLIQQIIKVRTAVPRNKHFPTLLLISWSWTWVFCTAYCNKNDLRFLGAGMLN